MNAELRNTIFPTQADYLNWNKQIEYTELNEEIDVDFKDKLINAFKILSEFLDYDSKNIDSRFILVEWLIYEAPWARQRIIWLANSLTNLKSSKGFQELLENLRIPSKFEEGLSVLETASKFFELNYELEFETEVLCRGKIKKPDITISGRSEMNLFHVEVSYFDHSIYNKTNKSVSNLLFWKYPMFTYVGIIHKDLEPNKLDYWLSELETKLDEAQKLYTLSIIKLEDRLTLAVTNRNDFENMQKFCKENNLRSENIYLPKSNFDPILRLKRKIQTKQKQLPEGKSNFIFLYLKGSQSLFFNHEKLLQELTEEVEIYSHVSAVIICDRWLGFPIEIDIKYKSSYALSISINEVEQNKLFVVVNDSSEIKFDKGELLDLLNKI